MRVFLLDISRPYIEAGTLNHYKLFFMKLFNLNLLISSLNPQ